MFCCHVGLRVSDISKDDYITTTTFTTTTTTTTTTTSVCGRFEPAEMAL
jgi:hypothetical protein